MAKLLTLKPYDEHEADENKKHMLKIGHDIVGRDDIPKGFVLQNGPLFEGVAPEGHSQPWIFQDGAIALARRERQFREDERQFRELLAVKSDDAGRQDIPRNSEGLPFFHGNAPHGHSQPWVFANNN